MRQHNFMWQTVHRQLQAVALKESRAPGTRVKGLLLQLTLETVLVSLQDIKQGGGYHNGNQETVKSQRWNVGLDYVRELLTRVK